MIVRAVLLAIGVMVSFAAAGARAAGWQPAPGHTQQPIWPAAVPDAQRLGAPESTGPVENHPVAGKPWTYVDHVARPTMTVYPPRARNTGVAVVVFPGGGYKTLAIDLEGTEVCEWLASRGITAVLLKYRVPDSGPHWNADLRRHEDAKAPMALEDAQRTIGLVRSRAAQLHVDARKIGVLGFSAGGHLVADVSTHWNRRAYRAVDAADTVSCRPDFAVALYPGHLLEHAAGEYDLNRTLPVSSRTPPTFLCHAVDDPIDPVRNTLVYYLALRRASVPVEMHLFAQGGHAFGLRPSRFPITGWPELMERWLGAIGMIAP